MLNFFLPSKTKKVLAESELIQGSLQRNRIYAQDILSAKDLETIGAFEARYPALLKARDAPARELEGYSLADAAREESRAAPQPAEI